jgi:beta-1,4-mannosyl-glycoprotein beta-1,4-N-acetylglucosaminyltransferase
MVYDIFTFFNELDLLEIRFKILNDKVDYFVIIECTETFSGKPKQLYFSENKHLFKEWEHKIIHHIIELTFYPLNFIVGGDDAHIMGSIKIKIPSSHS